MWQQHLLGALTFAVLLLLAARLEPGLRRQVLVCVGVATCFEVFGSLIWGVYRYRRHNIPLYVPPGHGLVYLFGLTAGATPLFARWGRRAAGGLLATCAAWAVLGVTLLPIFTHRVDVQGALCFPVFAWFVLRSPRYALFAAIFVATTELELAGTLFGDWTWQPVAPWTHLPSGNPPSAIAGGYCVIDGSVALVLILLSRPGSAWGRTLGVRVAGARRAPAAVRPTAAPSEARTPAAAGD